ncbi:MAG: hypothetical protein M3457_12320 [Chloroflexota bacterium]|nr:hypothetical protein [Chloroflexota bacterium]
MLKYILDANRHRFIKGQFIRQPKLLLTSIEEHEVDMSSVVMSIVPDNGNSPVVNRGLVLNREIEDLTTLLYEANSYPVQSMLIEWVLISSWRWWH